MATLQGTTSPHSSGVTFAGRARPLPSGPVVRAKKAPILPCTIVVDKKTGKKTLIYLVRTDRSGDESKDQVLCMQKNSWKKVATKVLSARASMLANADEETQGKFKNAKEVRFDLDSGGVEFDYKPEQSWAERTFARFPVWHSKDIKTEMLPPEVRTAARTSIEAIPTLLQRVKVFEKEGDSLKRVEDEKALLSERKEHVKNLSAVSQNSDRKGWTKRQAVYDGLECMRREAQRDPNLQEFEFAPVVVKPGLSNSVDKLIPKRDDWKKLFIPISTESAHPREHENFHSHMSGLFVDRESGRIYYYDPSGKKLEDNPEIENLAKGVASKIRGTFDIRAWPHYKWSAVKDFGSIEGKGTHQQGDGNCGRYVLNFFDHMMRGGDFDTFARSRIDRTELQRRMDAITAKMNREMARETGILPRVPGGPARA